MKDKIDNTYRFGIIVGLSVMLLFLFSAYKFLTGSIELLNLIKSNDLKIAIGALCEFILGIFFMSLALFNDFLPIEKVK